MLYDQVADFVARTHSRFEELANKEQAAKDPAATRDQRRTGERQAEELSKNLIADHPGWAVHHRAASGGEANRLRGAWQQAVLDAPSRPMMDLDNWGLEPWFQRTFNHASLDAGALAMLPFGSFAIEFAFRLKTPCLSGDDDDLYPIDNPVLRDHVFRLPMVAASSWKGSLRSAVREMIAEQAGARRQPTEADCEVLFGPPRDAGEETERREGRLRLFPTFFDQVGLEVINPHDRQKKIGARGPIAIESAPRGSTGIFRLLYVPFDQIGQPIRTIWADGRWCAKLLCQTIHHVFTVSGVGAKTSSGYGIAEDTLIVPGRITIMYPPKDPTIINFSTLGAPVATGQGAGA